MVGAHQNLNVSRDLTTPLSGIFSHPWATEYVRTRILTIIFGYRFAAHAQKMQHFYCRPSKFHFTIFTFVRCSRLRFKFATCMETGLDPILRRPGPGIVPNSRPAACAETD